MWRKTSLTIGAALVITATISLSTVWGQPPGGRGGPGFGGPGGGPMSGAMLLGMEEVQKELKLTKKQSTEIEELLAEAMEEMRGNFNPQELQGLSDEDRQARMEEMTKKMEELNKAVDEDLAEILKPKQLERLAELRLQREGVGAFVRPDVAEKLGLSDEQVDKIRKIQEESRPQFGGPPGGPPRGDGGPQAAPADGQPGGRRGGRGFQDMSDEERQKLFTQMRERREKAQNDVLAVLTDDQKTKWTEMKGEPFEFQRGGFGGRPGRGGGERQRPARKRDDS